MTNTNVKFGKIFGAALLAFLAGTAIVFTFFIFYLLSMVIQVASSPARVANVASHSVLQIDLGEAISEKPEPVTISSIDLWGMKMRTSYSLLSVLGAVEAAKNDDRIDGIYLIGAAMPGFSTAQGEELRSAIEDFRQSGKFVVAWSDYYSQSGYWVCSVADKVALSPEGDLSWLGVSANMMFFKGLLDKLDIRAEVIRHGNFKSAVEPFVDDRMSPENALQMNALVRSVWGTMVGEIARARNLDSARLDRLASELAIHSAAEARRQNMVDTLIYRDQALSWLGELVYGRDGDTEDLEAKTPEIISLGDYMSSGRAGRGGRQSRNEIAVLYADGEMVDGYGERGLIGGDSFAAKVEELRKDDNVLGVVLRINSPGGSAMAAERIWRELSLLQAKKPLVVSLGETAASGGYYIAAPADVIVTCRTSITGSIGVFGLMFDVESGLRNKLGITMDAAKSNPSADLEFALRPLTTAEKNYMQYQVDHVYTTFVGHVARGRNMTVEQADKIAQGRIWSGDASVSNGMCDSIGGLKEAIALTADRAGVAQNFHIREIVPLSNSFLEILSSIFSSRETHSLARSGIAAVLADYADAVSMLARRGVQARMPYIIKIE